MAFFALPALGDAIAGMTATEGLAKVDGLKNYTAPGPTSYANQFSEADARKELQNWQNDQKGLAVGSPAWKNVQSFIDALNQRIAAVAAKPVLDHPTAPAPPPALSIPATIATTIGDGISYLPKKGTDFVMKELGTDIPLPPGAFHRDITEGPNPLEAFWVALRTASPTHPIELIRSIWNVTVTTFEYVIWDFEEFVRLLRAWNGSVWMFTGHPQYLFDVVWRSLVTGLLVVGMVEIGPLLMVMTEWTKFIVEVFWNLGKWIGEGLAKLTTHSVRR